MVFTLLLKVPEEYYYRMHVDYGEHTAPAAVFGVNTLTGQVSRDIGTDQATLMFVRYLHIHRISINFAFCYETLSLSSRCCVLFSIVE